ncbi:MAG: hypothetical protein K2Y56_12875 [Methylobacterium sp.]|uniref:hypothetical protein n=1 Tax=Methylobacterium sp. TaxID=409 RepID=UPI0025ECBC26|nr:hypothetical protein [Methylobacterium sp.]MBX9932413.1 hypothetical protein [Methylobacterium sp.]
MRNLLHAKLAAILILSAASPAFALPTCGEGQRKLEEVSALRFQARQESRIGDRDRVCDTLDEIGDRVGDARDEFEDCGATMAAIDLRSESRALRAAKAVNRCN